MEFIGGRFAQTALVLAAMAALVGCQAVQGGSTGASTPPPSGTVTIANASLNFGTVIVGQSATLSDTITNGTSGTVSIAQPTVSAAGFNVTSPSFPLTIASGQSATLQVQFKPTSIGSQNGTVTVLGGSQTLVISVNGTANSSGTLSGSPSPLAFGGVQVGQSSSLTGTITNNGSASVTISQANLSGSGFSISGLTLPTTINANQSTTVSVRFAPQAAGAVSGNLAIVSNGSNGTLNIGLSGTGVTPGVVSANPSSLSFGNVATGSSVTKSETLTNSGGTAITVSSITPTGTGFSISGVNPPLTLSPGQAVTFSVVFAPQANGSFTGSLAIASNASNPSLSISITGAGVTPGQLAASPGTLSFGNVVVGTSGTQTGTLSATGSSVTVSSIGTTNSEFSVTGISLPLTIAAGSSASFTATFTPGASGSASGTLTFASNASNTPTTVTASGSGTPPPQHSVTLNWNASSSSNVVGYNVYRGGQAGGPYSKLNSALDTGTTDTDLTVSGGQTYYYVVTAVNSTGVESSYSNQVQAVIPFP